MRNLVLEDPIRAGEGRAAQASRARETPTTGLAEFRRLAGKFASNALNSIQRRNFWPARVRRRLVRMLGHQLSDGTFLSDGIYIRGVGLITRGEVFMNSRCFVDATCEIFIGHGAMIAPEVMLCTSTHDIGPDIKRAGAIKRAPIKIGEGCWIGSRAVILPGVEIAPGCIIAAGSVVTRDTKPNGLYAGIPAKKIRGLNADVHHFPTHPVEAVAAASLM